MLRKTFQFVATEKAAKELCKAIQSAQNSYRKRNHKPHYTPWESQDRTERLFVVWYVC